VDFEAEISGQETGLGNLGNLQWHTNQNRRFSATFKAIEPRFERMKREAEQPERQAGGAVGIL